MSLLGLPTELIDHIVESTLANGPQDGFEGIASSCKALYEVGRSHAPRYNELSQWRDLRIGAPNSTWPHVFKAIVHEPLLGMYVETLDLKLSYRGWDEAGDQLSRDDRQKVQETIINSPWLSFAGVNAGEWATRVLTHSPDDEVNEIYRAVFLLTLLPRLKALTLTERWPLINSEGEDCQKLLEILLEHAQRSPPRHDQPLGQLERLCPFERSEYDSHPRAGFDVVDCFMALPSLKEMHISNLIAVEDGYTGIPFRWRFPDYTSNIARLHLQGCCIDDSGIGELLMHMPHVESLRYMHSTKWHGCQHDWNAGAFVDAVAKHNSGTLKELVLTLDELFGEVEQGITSLKDFKVLRNVELDWNCFAAPPFGSEMSNGYGSDGPHDWTVTQMPSFSSILPASIEQITLLCTNGSDNVEPLRFLFRDAIHLPRSASTPALQSVQIRHWMTLSEWHQHLDDTDSTTAREDNDQQPFQSLRSLLETAGVHYSTT